MSDWTEGYVADIAYTFGYYTELNPLRIKLAFLNSGLAFPEVGCACELGFGQGMSVNIHAAASVAKWYGTDFNPSHTAFAHEIATASQSDAKLYDEAFNDFCNRHDLPDFDFIALHGIWSWISDETRGAVVDFIRRKLKVGGVLYISYNTLPGWAVFAPIRHLMAEHAKIMGSAGQGIINKVNGALEFTDRFVAANPAYIRANQQAGERIKKINAQNKHYLAHEYFNRTWDPMYFSEMAEWLEPAKLSYACPATYIHHIDAINFTPDQQTFLKSIPDIVFRETVKDYMVNQQFRKDYWVKGARKISGLQQIEALRNQKVVLVSHRPEISNKITGMLTELKMNEAIYSPILDYLADHSIKTLGQIEQAAKAKGIGFNQVLQSVLILASSNHIVPVLEDGVVSKAKSVSDRLNLCIMEKARYSGDLNYLSSPVSGGGILVPRIHQLFLLAINQDRKIISDMAAFAWSILKMQGQKMIKDGKILETQDESIAELIKQAEEFSEKRLPVLKALQIC